VVKYLKNRHLGERVIIICNGPSLNNMDLSFLKNNICIGLNKIYLGFKKFEFYPKYFVSVNEKVLRQSKDEIKKLSCVKFLSNRCQDIFENNALTHIINTDTPPERFCKDISCGLEEGWTVTFAALQVAYYLGFEEVILIGMDHNFDFQGKPNAESKMKGDDPNHFHSGYFANGVKWDNPDLKKSEESYYIAKNIYELDGRRIIDATINGKCNVFEKVDYKNIFGVVK